MTDRWRNRPEPAPGEGVVSWHMLMRDYPEVVDLAARLGGGSQDSMALHMTPLHLAAHHHAPRRAAADRPRLLGAGRCDPIR